MEFKVFYLEELLKIKNGKDHKSLNDGNYPVYGSGGLMRYADKYLYDKVSILLPRKGTLDNIQYVTEPFWNVDTIYYTEVNEELVNPYYLFRYLRAMDLSGYDSGASIPSMTTKSYNIIKVKLPPLVIQNQIADIIRKYDELIEINNQRIKKLEQTAEELYKEWFVRFRFPNWQNSEFENGIPKGWVVGKINDIVSIFDKQRIPLSSMTRDNMEKIYPYYGAAELLDYVDDYIFDGKYLLLGEDGSVVTTEGYPVLQLVYGKFWVNNHAHILQGKNGFSTESLYLTFKKMNVTGVVTGSAQPKISQARFLNRHILLPECRVLSLFNKLIQPLFNKRKNLLDINSNLIKQRDLLLPRLMSGKLEVQNEKDILTSIE